MSTEPERKATTRCCASGPEANCCCCRVEWAMWGNVNALYAATFIFIGGIVAATVDTITLDGSPPHNFGTVTRWGVILIGLTVFFVEYPRSARRTKKTNVERPGQKYLAPLLHIIGVFGRNYIVRFLFYLVLLVPCFFVLSAVLGAMCLFFACICYFIAALNGEEWKAPSLAWGPGAKPKEEPQVGHSLPEAPSHPPPRPPPQLKYGISEPPSEPPPRPTARKQIE